METADSNLWPGASRSRLVAAGVLAAISIVSATAVVLGAPLWVLALAGVAPLLLARARWGTSVALAVVLVFSLFTALVVLIVSHLVPIPMLLFFSVVVAVAAVGSSFLLARSGFGPRASRPVGWLMWGGALVGPALWFATFMHAVLRTGAAPLVLVTRGDAPNYILFAHRIIVDNGIALGVKENPVPLPAGLMSLMMDAARQGRPAAESLATDVGAFATLWMILVAVTCVFAGVTAARMTPASRPIVRGVVATIGSLLPLTWFISGIPLEYGFFNTHIIMPVVLAALIVGTAERMSAPLRFAILCVTGTLLLAVWAPLVLIPAALAAVVVLREWRALVSARGPLLVVLVLGIVQLAVYGVFVSLPTLMAIGKQLTAPGAIYPLSRLSFVAFASAAVLFAVLVRSKMLSWNALALIAGLGAGLAFLLVSNRHSATFWTYYPLKYLWFASVILIVLALGLLGAVIAENVRNGVLVAVAFLASIGLAFSIISQANTTPGYDAKNAVSRVRAADAFGADGEATLARVFELSAERQPTLLWNSGAPDDAEGRIDSWLLQVLSERHNIGDKLRSYAYYLDRSKTEDLCGVADLLGPGLRVITADPVLQDSINERCADAGIEVVPAG